MIRRILILLLISFSTFLGCSGDKDNGKLVGFAVNNNPGSASQGTLRLSLAASKSSSEAPAGAATSYGISALLTAASISPSLDMVPASYAVRGTGPEGSSFSVATASATVDIPHLRFGAWDIQVEAFNDDPIPVSIGSGTNTATIVAGATTPCTVIVAPYSGFGSLALSLAWNDASITNPVIEATITRNGGIPAALAFTVAGGQATAGATLAAGYYTVNCKLYTDGGSGSRVFLGGGVEIVRIVKDQQTSGAMTIAVNSAALDGTGGITIIPSMNDPITVVLSGTSAVIAQGSAVTVQASAPSETGTITYTWYLNGASQAAGPSYTIAGLGAGQYRLDVTAFNADGSRGGSATCSFEVVAAASANIIADHTIVADYDKIPAYYLNEVKKMLVAFPGESHSAAYRTGMELLEAQNAAYACNVGTGEAPTDQYVRVNSSGAGEAIWYTWYAYDNHDGANKSVIKSMIAEYAGHGHPMHALGFGWCWDTTWVNGVTGAKDPVYGCGWAGASEGGPDGNRPWGLDADDYSITGNRVSLDTYLEATEEYRAYCLSNGYPTRIIFTTGPVDGYSGESGYQRFLKHEGIRGYVRENPARILFDYADILCHDDDGTAATESWNGHVFPRITNANLGDGSVAHISAAGALRIAKAQWWMLARIAGWDGVSR